MTIPNYTDKSSGVMTVSEEDFAADLEDSLALDFKVLSNVIFNQSGVDFRQHVKDKDIG